MGRLQPWPKYYRSVEHNIDMFAFARMIGNGTYRDHASKFVQSMFGKDESFKGVWAVGTGDSVECDTSINSGEIPVDAQMWNVAAGADLASDRVTSAFEFSLVEVPPPLEAENASYSQIRLQGLFEQDVDYIGNAGKGVGEVYSGFRFSNSGNGIQWENAAAALVAMVKHREGSGHNASELTDRIIKTRESVKKLLEVYGSVPASILGGNFQRYEQDESWKKNPGGSDTGMGWAYFRYQHLASTVWSGFSLMQQGNEGEKVDAESNPYAAPLTPVPSPGDTQCIPAASQPNGDATCNAHPACLGMVGNCCPTDAGVILGCCTGIKII